MKPHTYNCIARILILPILITCAPLWGAILHMKVPSLALGDSNRVIVATPSQFDGHKKGGYPFILMLHGWSGDETQWEDDANLQALSDKHDILLILPDGGYDGWWVDTNLQPDRNYDTHLHQELIIWTVEYLNGSRLPSQHGVMGLSMGGFGAIYQALKHPDYYAAVASLSGVMDITQHTDNWHLSNAFGLYEVDSVRWVENNPLNLAEKKAPKYSPYMLLICGRDDFTFKENQEIAKELKDMGYKSEFREEAGTHSHTFWKTHVDAAIAFIVSHFRE